MVTKLKAFNDALIQKLKNLLNLLKQDISTLWTNNKAFVIIFGGLLLVIKFRQILINLIVNSSKALYNNAQNESNKDQLTENKDNAQANQLVQQSEALPNSEGPITDDWYKKK